MSNLCQTCLEPRLTAAVNTVASTNPASDFVLGSVGVSQLCASHARSVCNFTDLLELGTVAAGTLVFVQDVAVPVIYNNGRWLGLDGRVFINTSSVSVMWSWGANSVGQLGDSTTISRSSPGISADDTNAWCSVTVGYMHNSAVKLDGTLWTWGCNSCGQLGDSSTASRSSPGAVAGIGTTWCQSSSGLDHTAAIKTDGTLWTWGRNYYGRLGTNTTVNRSSPGLTSGGGTTWCTVSAGVGHTSAVKIDGTLWTWGSNVCGKLGNGTTVSRSSPGTTADGGRTWCTVVAGGDHTAAIKTDGTLWTWGLNGCGRLGDGTTTNRCSPGGPAGGGTTWCAISAGVSSTAAVKTDGTLWTWGNNYCGKLGDGTTTNRCSPGATAGGGTTWCTANVRCIHTAAVKTDGTLWTWGGNAVGQLGTNTTTNRSSPGTTAGAGTTWCAANAGACHTVALTVTRGA